MIVSDTIYHNIECCLRNMVSEDDETKKQRIAAHILRVLDWSDMNLTAALKTAWRVLATRPSSVDARDSHRAHPVKVNL